MSPEMVTLTNCRYALMKATHVCSLLILLLNMVHDNEDQNQRQNQRNHRLWRHEKVLYLSASSLCQHIHLLRCVRHLEISIFTSGKLPSVCETNSAVVSIWIARHTVWRAFLLKKILQATNCKKSMERLSHLFAGVLLTLY